MKILITFGSITGSTEKVADMFWQYTKQKVAKSEVDLVDMTQLLPNKLLDYDLVIIGCSTWMDGDMNDVAISFFERLEATNIGLNQIPFAIFGVGDKRYETYCTAVEIMVEKLKKLKAKTLTKTLKIDGLIDDRNLALAQVWLEKILISQVKL